MNNHPLLEKFKIKARLADAVQSKELDFPFTNLQLQSLDTEEKRELLLNNLLITGEQMANKIFKGVDDKLILFFAAYMFVYNSPKSNFRKPDFFEISLLDQDVPYQIHQIENNHIRFGLYETAKNVKSNAAFYFCYEFAIDLNGTSYDLKKSEFKVEDLLAKVGAPFILDEVETCKKFLVFDGRRPANEARLFLFDVEAGHIEALKIKNPIGTSYEYDENFMAYGRVRGTFVSPFLKYKTIHISRNEQLTEKNDQGEAMFTRIEHHINIIDIENDSDLIDEKILGCEKLIFI